MQMTKPKTAFEKKTRTVSDTIGVSPETVKKWVSPPFQRPVKENEKVRNLADELKRNDGVWPGVVTLGVLDGVTYLVDGQHRKAAFLLSECKQGYTDVRIHYFESLAQMGEEFVLLNSQLARINPDDILRGLESACPPLADIRSRCGFVGYDMIRRGPKCPMASMSAALRCWRGSANDVPSNTGQGMSSASIAQTITMDEAGQLCGFLEVAYAAWGRDPEYSRLWSNLNMTLCMWLYRRLVLTQYSSKTPRLTKDQFKRCLMSLSTDSNYIDWLLGRNMGERDRSPAYTKIKHNFVQRISADQNIKASLPAPAWHSQATR